jgi:hypothetical protein
MPLSTWPRFCESAIADKVMRNDRSVDLHGCILYRGVVHRHIKWNCPMIVSFRDEWLRAFFADDTRSRLIRPISKADSSASSR